MESIWQWGLVIITDFQSVRGPFLDTLFEAMSFLGEEEFYLLLFPTLLWCVDTTLGFRLGVLVLISFYLNSLAKDLIGHPRPFALDPSVQLASGEGFGLPSGHAQSSALVWGGIAAHVRSRWMWIIAILLAGLIGLSRIYLGVHFPTDVLGGWMLGVAVLLVGSAVYRAAADRFQAPHLGITIGLAIAGPAALALLFPDQSAVSAMGALAGLVPGFAISTGYLAMSSGGPPWQRILRLPLGLGILFILYAGLKIILPGEESALHLAFRFARYGVLGLWITLGAPWLFAKVGLQGRLPTFGGTGARATQKAATNAIDDPSTSVPRSPSV